MNRPRFSSLLLAASFSLLAAVTQAAPALPHNPLDRLLLRERLRVQILQKTHGVPPAHYQAVVVPRLQAQLTTLGFQPDEVRDILLRVEETRARGPW